MLRWDPQNAEAFLLQKYFRKKEDSIHPSDAGQLLLTQMIAQLLRNELLLIEKETTQQQSFCGLALLPPPILEANYEFEQKASVTSLCATGSNMQNYVQEQRGWQLVDEMSSQGQTKVGMIAYHAHAVLDTCFPITLEHLSSKESIHRLKVAGFH